MNFAYLIRIVSSKIPLCISHFFILLITELLALESLENAALSWAKTQFKIFSGCHMKQISLRWSTSTENLWDIFSFDESHTFTFEQFVLKLESRKEKIVNATTRNFHTSGKFQTCFVHVYIPHQNTFQYFHLIMDELQSRGEWANHCIFIETLEIPEDYKMRRRNLFYQSKVPISNVRGLIIATDIRSKTMHLMCVPCAWWFGYEERGKMLESINLDGYQTLEDVYTQKSYHAHSNLQGSKHVINTNSDYIARTIEYCDFGSKDEKIVLDHGLLQCIHFFLHQHLNYSFMKRKFDELNYIFASDTEAYVSTQNLNHADYLRKKKEWLSPGAVSYRISVVGFQNLPRFSGNVLLQPYDWQSWALFVSAAVAMLLLTLSFALISYQSKPTPFMLGSLAISIVASILDQQTQASCDISVKTKLYNSKVLAVTWLLWTTVLITLVDAYRGSLFSFLTTGSEPVWPSSIKEFVDSGEYCFITTQKHELYDRDVLIETTSFVRTEYLKPMMTGTAGIDYGLHLFKLNQTLQFFDEQDFGVVREIIVRSWNYRNRDNRAGFDVDGHNCQKFTLIQSNAADDAVNLIYSLPDLATSDPLLLPGFRRVTSAFATRNFFTEPFMRGIGGLEQGGFLRVLESHVAKWKICTRMWEIKLFLVFDQINVNGLNQTMLRCLTQVHGSVTNPNTLREPQSPKAFTSQQLITTYKMFGLCLAFSLVAFALEKFKFILFKQNGLAMTVTRFRLAIFNSRKEIAKFVKKMITWKRSTNSISHRVKVAHVSAGNDKVDYCPEW